MNDKPLRKYATEQEESNATATRLLLGAWAFCAFLVVIFDRPEFDCQSHFWNTFILLWALPFAVLAYFVGAMLLSSAYFAFVGKASQAAEILREIYVLAKTYYGKAYGWAPRTTFIATVLLLASLWAHNFRFGVYEHVGAHGGYAKVNDRLLGTWRTYHVYDCGTDNSDHP